MILANLEDSKMYESVHPLFKQAFEYLRSVNLNAIPAGKINLSGENIVVNVNEITRKSKDEAKMETHRKFIDIQVPISDAEFMGWKSAEKLNSPIDGYNAEKDMALYNDSADVMLKVQPGEFAVFFPEDGHQPGIGEGYEKKIIVKVKC